MISEDGISYYYYWKTTARTDLYSGRDADTYANSIAVAGADVYTAGCYIEDSVITACYWKNGEKTDLQAPYSSAEAITVDGEDVYAAGTYFGYVFTACYWKNGVLTDLHPAGAIESAAYAIAIAAN
jgi:uncharacterized membrane protein